MSSYPNETLDTNNTLEESHLDNYDILQLVLVSIVLGLLIVATVAGNVFVIFAILLTRTLRSTANSLVLSLAVADLLVGILVMPLGAVYEVTQEWNLGPILCELWTSCDVLCCTASILHLLAIAIDRYWAVTDIDYARQRSRNKIGIMIVVVWVVSAAISCAPFLGWKDDGFVYRTEVEKRCLVSQDVWYQIFATCSSFYVPLILVLVFYWRIFQEARKRIRRRPGSRAILNVEKSFSSSTTTTTTGDLADVNGVALLTAGVMTAHRKKAGFRKFLLMARYEKKESRRTLERKKENKAARTLAIITCVFIVCWLPFFIVVLLMAVCTVCEPGPELFSVLLWLGYANSLMNPVIYTVFSPDFRNAFRRILCLSAQSTLVPL